MSFEKLLAELDSEAQEQETMNKALPADDGKDDLKIQAAAEEGGGMDDEDDLDLIDETDDEDEGEPLGKSLGKVRLEDGEEVEAIDGTELVKSLMGDVKALQAKQTESEDQMVKALGKCVSLLKSQNAMIKSLQAASNKHRTEGRGRKTLLNVNEKPAAGSQMAKSEDSGMSQADFLAKSHAAFDAGKITGLDLTTIDVSLRQGTAIEPNIIQKVLS